MSSLACHPPGACCGQWHLGACTSTGLSLRASAGILTTGTLLATPASLFTWIGSGLNRTPTAGVPRPLHVTGSAWTLPIRCWRSRHHPLVQKILPLIRVRLDPRRASSAAAQAVLSCRMDPGHISYYTTLALRFDSMAHDVRSGDGAAWLRRALLGASRPCLPARRRPMRTLSRLRPPLPAFSSRFYWKSYAASDRRLRLP